MKLKKGFYWAAGCSTGCPGGKNSGLAGLGEAMDNDYRSAWNKFWQIVQRNRKGQQCSANTFCSAGVDLQTLAGDMVGRSRDYFEQSHDTRDSEEDSATTQAKVTMVASKLLSSSASRVGEIDPEYLKSLDAGRLSLLTHLCNIMLQSEIVPLEWQTRVVVPDGVFQQ